MRFCPGRARVRLRPIHPVGFYCPAISVVLTCVFRQAFNVRDVALARRDSSEDTAVVLSLCPSTVVVQAWSLRAYPAIRIAHIARIHSAPSCTSVV